MGFYLIAKFFTYKLFPFQKNWPGQRVRAHAPCVQCAPPTHTRTHTRTHMHTLLGLCPGVRGGPGPTLSLGPTESSPCPSPSAPLTPKLTTFTPKNNPAPSHAPAAVDAMGGRVGAGHVLPHPGAQLRGRPGRPAVALHPDLVGLGCSVQGEGLNPKTLLFTPIWWVGVQDGSRRHGPAQLTQPS
jgi:hypothetical protein